MTTTIMLGKSVIVSDPGYDNNERNRKGIFSLLTILKGVLPGKYNVYVKRSDMGNWGIRNSVLLVVHSKYAKKVLEWKKHKGTVYVDSGQAGIFDEQHYRDDDAVSQIPWIKKKPLWKLHPDDDKGELWYMKMCDITLNQKERWGVYETGAVSSSGLGDGGYDLYTAKVDKKIVGIAIDFQVDSPLDVNFYRKK